MIARNHRHASCHIELIMYPLKPKVGDFGPAALLTVTEARAESERVQMNRSLPFVWQTTTVY